MRDIRQSVQYAKFLKSQGWIVKRTKNTNYFIKKLPLIGSILKIQRPEKLDLNCIDVLIHQYKVFQIIIEPKITILGSPLTVHGFRLSNSPYLPTKTIQINLTQSKEKIYSNFSKNCRYGIRQGSSSKIKVYSTPEDIKLFHTAWKNSVNFGRYVPSYQTLLNLKKSFPNNYSIFLTSHNMSGSIIGGALFTRSSHDIAYYWYGFTNKEGRTSLSQYSLLYSGILWGKKMSCKIFDFEGIYDPRFPNKSWVGFTHFKKSFGGIETLYPGCYTKFNWHNIFHHFR